MEEKKLINKKPKSKYMSFRGATHFRIRIICATLSGKSIEIDDIRSNDTNPGLRDYEASFLKLIEKITNGCKIQINETGTRMRYIPGILVGGSGIEHQCPNSRSVGYFIEYLLVLSLFGKKPLSITLHGITNDDKDLNVDIIGRVTIPLIKSFGIEEDFDFKINKRGSPPLGGGEVYLRCPIAKELKPINIVDEGLVKKIRGIAYTSHGIAQMGNLMVDGARGILNSFIPDVWIHTDHVKKGHHSGLSPGGALSLFAETTTGRIFTAQCTAGPGPDWRELGKLTASMLCEEIAKGGCVDSSHQSIMLLLMMLCPEDISKIRTGPLSPYTIQCLRIFRHFFGIMFKIHPQSQDKTVLLSCLGIGYKNTARKIV